jgi:hypothetical protein
MTIIIFIFEILLNKIMKKFMIFSILFALLTMQILSAVYGLKAFSVSGIQEKLLNESKVPPIPLGKWDFNSNGVPGILNLTSIDGKGKLSGTIELYPWDSKTPIRGYYDEQTGKISFVRSLGKNITDIEVYTGYKLANVIADCIDGTGPGSCYQLSKIAGTFDSFVDHQTNGTKSFLIYSDSKRNTFGWFASHEPLPCPACPH